MGFFKKPISTAAAVKMQKLEKGNETMTTVKKGTKKAQGMIDNYIWYTRRNGIVDIYTAYKNPSIYKARAWYQIKEMCDRLNGYGLTVLGHNCMKYTAAFKAIENGVEKLFYFTADYDYVMEI